MNKKSSGYILVLTLLVISVLTILVTQIFYQSSSNLSLMNTLVNKEKAKILALSGIQLSIDRLSVRLEKENSESKKLEIPGTTRQGLGQAQKKPETISSASKLNKELLTRILPVINKWQTVELKESEDGISGKLNICICCENGKLNINKIYDFKKHQFVNSGQIKNDYLKLMQDFFKKMEVFADQKDVMQAFQGYLADRQFPLNETTELLNIKFGYFKENVFYRPSISGEKKQIFLTDLFTVWTQDNKLEPWLLSNSVQVLLGLDANQDNIEKRNQVVPDWISKFKSSFDWSKDWNDILKPVYQREFTSLPHDLVGFLNSTFTAKIFSVISYGTVAGVTQKVYGILQLTTKNDAVEVSLKKLYWL
ncbi:hypothetical protein A3F66_06495 [candidate division TM6 bacterium RIFCSPHIGHO2_12_FULL_32_22]|nr:MAG: hypothetical protein A3F66_06495 [candidate division TM6 bacterium RIFCSPHIGHO2_12_FULL_32_22]